MTCHRLNLPIAEGISYNTRLGTSSLPSWQGRHGEKNPDRNFRSPESRFFGPLAQSAEHRTFNAMVARSNRTRPTKNKGLAFAKPFLFGRQRLVRAVWLFGAG